MSNENHAYIAKTIHGLEEVLQQELINCGASNVTIGRRVVHFEGDKEVFYRSIYWCRTAISILKPIFTKKVRDQDEYYAAINSIPWYRIFPVDRTFMIKAVVSGKMFTNSHFASLRAKDAVVDHFRKEISDRPNVSKHEPDMVIHVHLRDEALTVSLDGAGFPLFKRGYRASGGGAPLNEVLAAGIIMISGWDGSTTLIDPMCGSGTFSIEAGLLALGQAPQSVRSYFSIQDWSDYDDALFDKVRSKPLADSFYSEGNFVYASDIDSDVLKLAKKNAFRAGLQRRIKFSVSAFEDLEKPDGPCTIFLNPPYGERLVEEDINGMYMRIGNTLKHKWPGCTAWILSSNFDAIKHIGLRPSRKITVYNGPLECKLLRYDMYEGKKSDTND